MKMKVLLKVLLLQVMLAGLCQNTWAQIPYKIVPFKTPFGGFKFQRPNFPD